MNLAEKVKKDEPIFWAAAEKRVRREIYRCFFCSRYTSHGMLICTECFWRDPEIDG